MPKHSAGLLPYRVDKDQLWVFIAHPGGPFWARKDEGVWSIIKGEYDPACEDARAAAGREFTEETGVPAPGNPETWIDLGQVRQNPSKIVRAYAVQAPSTLTFVASNTCQTEHPRGSGRIITVPEVDRAEWMTCEQARTRLLAGQREFLDRIPRT
ncbi:NUDIX domain-containing protein [Dermatophilus congolensis]|uniref:NUDIX domain-containing protein n=1 Tax=Dermatophilus congolensis TaxID=1863 RepID=UPI001AB017EC|nr:NUDIX domain-containing protein [Dermatophilus congolensis]MBO3143616.1 NUDIX domain-containing protein [Dermatophilus congolensis]MBO3152609.1 NUDIX domain-containing protein [Dermatophilus congolensis]MBO3160380.1 NUDIX domain-containing protein [Dermatophilus congolensis]MBO3163893.1 NUDIX domain-containing protein [Dermatophilus congolensis]MBO3177440.1 NUDIX domain-containing protein [Dermatophilus congolensis]